MIRVLIVDDDFGMRMIIRKALSKRGGFEIVGEAENGEVALQMFEEYRPEVVFMDVDMPIMSGIECARKIFDVNPKTKIIFATAHEGYMSQAFEVYAFDYILKPFDIERLNASMDRIKQQDSEEPAEMQEMKVKNNANKLMIKNKEGVIFIDCNDIILIQREERKTNIYTVDGMHSTSESLAHVEERLDPRIFLRSHKSYIVNILKITNVYPYGRWTYIVKFGEYEYDALITKEKFGELEKIFTE